MEHNHHAMDSGSATDSPSQTHAAALASTVLSSLVAAATATPAPAASPQLQSSHDHHGSADAAPMAMFFTTSYRTPVLFGGLAPANTGAAVGLGLAIFLLAVAYRGLVCLRAHLEATHWAHPRRDRAAFRLFDDGGGSDSSSGKEKLHGDGSGSGGGAALAQPFSLGRDAGRMAMAFVTATVGYALMLIVMSFVVVCFPPSAPRLPR